MTAIELLKLLNEQGITLSVDGSDLRISAPKGTLTDALQAALVQHKSELLEILSDSGRTQQLTPTDRHATLPLSFAQQRLWFLDQLDPGGTLYNIPSALRVTGKLNRTALERAINQVVVRHEILRTAFSTQDRQPIATILEQVEIPLLIHDALNLNEDQLASKLTELANLPFQLDQPPLLRAHCIAVGTDQHILLFVVHHIIADGGSLVTPNCRSCRQLCKGRRWRRRSKQQVGRVAVCRLRCLAKKLPRRAST